MSNYSTPLVSCIMPTSNRRRFVSQAIWYFLQQDYAARELIIVDDGSDAVADLVPLDSRIRYVRLESRQSVGAKRNMACEASQGVLIAHWDDDDWYAPNRLSLQVAALLASEKDVCGINKQLFYNMPRGEAWLYRYPPDKRAWLAGSTLLYRRSTWQAHPFPDQNVGEDTAFVWGLPPERLHAMTEHTFVVGIIHDDNTSSKSQRSARWQRRPLSEATQLLAPERAFYVALRHGRPVPRPDFNADLSSNKINFTNCKLNNTQEQVHVTVSIPYFECKPYIRRAVESILVQTHTNLTVVVVNDGDEVSPWDQLADITDPRLIRFDLPANRGPYFAHAVVLKATSSPYFLTQDADDWSAPKRLATLLDVINESDVAVSAFQNYKLVEDHLY